MENRKQNISPRKNQIFNTQRENNKNNRPPFSSSFEQRKFLDKQKRMIKMQEDKMSKINNN